MRAALTPQDAGNRRGRSLVGIPGGRSPAGSAGSMRVAFGREGPPASPASLGAAGLVLPRRGPREGGDARRLPGPAGGRVAGRPRELSGNLTPLAAAAGRFLAAGYPRCRGGRVSGRAGLREARPGPGSCGVERVGGGRRGPAAAPGGGRGGCGQEGGPACSRGQRSVGGIDPGPLPRQDGVAGRGLRAGPCTGLLLSDAFGEGAHFLDPTPRPCGFWFGFQERL